MKPALRVVRPGDKPKRARKTPPKALPRESAHDIAARIRSGRKPARERLFFETVKDVDDLVITSIGQKGPAQSSSRGGGRGSRDGAA